MCDSFAFFRWVPSQFHFDWLIDMESDGVSSVCSVMMKTEDSINDSNIQWLWGMKKNNAIIASWTLIDEKVYRNYTHIKFNQLAKLFWMIVSFLKLMLRNGTSNKSSLVLSSWIDSLLMEISLDLKGQQIGCESKSTSVSSNRERSIAIGAISSYKTI